jgi:pimeloyl-ACP methyl ester carboxylesterase
MTIRTLEGAGLRLIADVEGDERGVPVIFLHGGGQTRSSWGKALAAVAARGFHALSIDMRGHGDSDRAPTGDYALDDFASDLRAVAASLQDRPFIVGASLGGLAAIVALGEAPRLPARGLVLVDVVPRVEEEGRREIVAFMRSAPEGFATLEEAGAAVAAYLPHREPPKNLDGLKRNLREGADGRWRWHWDPAFVLRTDRPDPEIEAERLERAARSLELPTLLIRGGFSRVVSPEGARSFLADVPHAELVDVAGADHMVAGDRNDVFNAAVLSFLDRNMSSGASASGEAHAEP